jgi:hypothetical protein
MVTHRACVVDRFLDWKVARGALATNPFAELRRNMDSERPNRWSRRC